MYVRGYLQGSENGRVVKLKAKEVEPEMLFGKFLYGLDHGLPFESYLERIMK